MVRVPREGSAEHSMLSCSLFEAANESALGRVFGFSFSRSPVLLKRRKEVMIDD